MLFDIQIQKARERRPITKHAMVDHGWKTYCGIFTYTRRDFDKIPWSNCELITVDCEKCLAAIANAGIAKPYDNHDAEDPWNSYDTSGPQHYGYLK